MHSKSGILNYPKIDKIVFALSVFVCLFWLIGQVVNVYRFAVAGALFEIAWLPMLALFFILPIISILLLIKKNVSFKELPLYSLLLLIFTFVLLALNSKT